MRYLSRDTGGLLADGSEPLTISNGLPLAENDNNVSNSAWIVD